MREGRNWVRMEGGEGKCVVGWGGGEAGGRANGGQNRKAEGDVKARLCIYLCEEFVYNFLVITVSIR